MCNASHYSLARGKDIIYLQSQWGGQASRDDGLCLNIAGEMGGFGNCVYCNTTQLSDSIEK